MKPYYKYALGLFLVVFGAGVTGGLLSLWMTFRFAPAETTESSGSRMVRESDNEGDGLSSLDVHTVDVDGDRPGSVSESHDRYGNCMSRQVTVFAEWATVTGTDIGCDLNWEAITICRQDTCAVSIVDDGYAGWMQDGQGTVDQGDAYRAMQLFLQVMADSADQTEVKVRPAEPPGYVPNAGTRFTI